MANGKFGGGNGTTTAPYLVEDAEDLKAIGKLLTSHFKQVRDIDMSGVDWGGIGSSATGFTGSYEGQGYKVSNITRIITIDSFSHPNEHIGGLFNRINSPSIVQNINLDRPSIELKTIKFNTSSQVYLGSLIGFLGSGAKTRNIVITGGNLSATVVAGGTSYSQVSMGGAIGLVHAGQNSPEVDKIVSVRAEVNITKNGDVRNYVGGIVGDIIYNSDGIKDCHYSGTIYAPKAECYGIARYVKCIDCTVSNSTIDGSIIGGINYLSTATRCHVSNTTLRSTDTNMYRDVCGISVASSSNPTIEHCSVVDCTIISARQSSGICGGYNYYAPSIRNCLVKNTTITGLVAAGIGVAGYLTMTDCAVIDCDIKSTGSSCGGLYSPTLDSNYSTGNATRCLFSGTVQGTGTHLAGLVASPSSNSSVVDSFFLGEFIKGLGGITSNVGRISSVAYTGNSNNYSLDTSQIILE